MSALKTNRADVFSPAKRSDVMRAVKGANTGPEVALRKALFARGLRYSLHRADLPGKPDLVFPARRAVIFVHGCFWHGHDCARGARVPKTNRAYWTKKVAGNTARDAAHLGALAELGWRARTVWECDLKDLARAANEAARWLLRQDEMCRRKSARHPVRAAASLDDAAQTRDP